jgi:acyl-CoA synthetase (AMP-forming)/AMP-acid ligase II
MTSAAPPVADLVELHGPPAGTAPTLAEIIRPFDQAKRGITFLDGSERHSVSYRELARLAAAVASRLRRLGVHPGDRVALTLGNELESIVILLGIWAAGATVVSVPIAAVRDLTMASPHFGPVLHGADCAFLISEDPAAGAAEEAGLRLIPASQLRGLPPEGRPVPEAELDGVGLIQFTSGSMSAPKGVAISSAKLAGHAAVVANAYQIDSATDRLVSWLPLYHDLGLVAMFLSALAARADLVLMPPRSFAYGPARWIQTLAAEHGTMTAAPNFAYRLAGNVPYGSEIDLSRVRLALSGGERITWSALEAFHRTTAPLGMSWEALKPAYGLAESTVGTTLSTVGPAQGPGGHVCVGQPLAGMSVKATAGPVPGPIHIRGDWLFDGYFTVDGYIPTPAGDWFDTGDEGWIHDGGLYVHGRRAEVIAVAGRNVFAEDLEAAVYDAEVGNVGACAAFRVGEGGNQFGLMIEVPTRPRRSPAEIEALGRRARAAASAAAGVRVDAVMLVRSGAIPKTTSGKVQRGRCRHLAADGLGRKLLTYLD